MAEDSLKTIPFDRKLTPEEWKSLCETPFPIENEDGHIDIQTVIMRRMAAKNMTVRTLAWLVGMSRPAGMARFLKREIQLRSLYLFRIFRILGIEIAGAVPPIADHPNLAAYLEGQPVPERYSSELERKPRIPKVWRRGRNPEDFFVDKDHGASWV